jgi:hypothetical protein
VWKIERILVAAALAAAAVGLTPSPASAATPTQLVSNAQWDAVKEGMTVAQVQSAIGGKRIYLDYESTSSWYPSGTVVFRSYLRSGRAGDCFQTLVFNFDNIDDSRTALGPMTLDSKAKRLESGCAGIVK